MKQKNNQKLSQQQLIIQRIVVGVSVVAALSVIIFIIINLTANTPSKAGTGLHGSKTVSTANVILNEFTKLTVDAAAGATSIKVAASSLNANGRFLTSLCPGELVMIIQMQGATINATNTSSYGSVIDYNNAGKYEFAEVLLVSNSTTIVLGAPLKNSYTATGNVQVVRVPRYTQLTINSGASVTTDAWNGTTGGIVAVEVEGKTTVNGSINVSGLGFRGGVVEWNTSTDVTSWYSTDKNDGAEKGEGIAGYQLTLPGGRYGRGAPANGGGGGNAHNGAGGGGANAGDINGWNGKGNPDTSVTAYITAWQLEASNFYKNVSTGGGRGGYTWSNATGNPLTRAPGNTAWDGDSRRQAGGYGGRPLDTSTGRIFMGGGGGAGDSNDNNGTSGANGGGIVFILGDDDIKGTGTITANGNNAGTTNNVGNGDGSGGGGGGGTIILIAKGASVKTLTVNAKGGRGGMQNIAAAAAPEAEGAGGGGGGGYIAYTATGGATFSVAGGQYGTSNAPGMSSFPQNGATSGAPGIITTAVPSNPYSSISLLPVKLVSFNAKQQDCSVVCRWTTASEVNNDYFSIERKREGDDFQSIGRIPGSGTTSTTHSYSFTDNNPRDGLNYYRLMQRDYDGTATYSSPVAVRISNIKKELVVKNIFPNPFKKEFNVTLLCGESQPVSIRLFSTDGKTMADQQMHVEAGSTTVSMSVDDNIPPGIYVLSVTGSDLKPAVKNIIKR